MNRVKDVITELIIGICIHSILFLILGIIFMRPFWLYALSLVVGALFAVGQVYHMCDTLDRALDLAAKNARSFTTIRSVLRMVVCLALMIGAIMIHWVSFVGVTVGLLGLKTSAFLNPFIRTRLNRCQHSEQGNEDI